MQQGSSHHRIVSERIYDHICTNENQIVTVEPNQSISAKCVKIERSTFPDGSAKYEDRVCVECKTKYSDQQIQGIEDIIQVNHI